MFHDLLLCILLQRFPCSNFNVLCCRKTHENEESVLSKDSGLEDSLSDSPIPNSSRTSSPVSSSSSRQSSSEECPGVKEVIKKHQSFQSLLKAKDNDKPKPAKTKTLGPKNLSFISALQKFTTMSASTPNLNKIEDVTDNHKTRRMSKSSSRTIETQTDSVATSHRSIQTVGQTNKTHRSHNNDRLYARSASISNLYSSGQGSVPNCDKNRTNNLLQGLSRYRGSQRLLQTRHSDYSVYNSCDNIVSDRQHHKTFEQPKKRHPCCTGANWRSNETIGVYNTKHFEHNQDYCNQRYYEPNPLYGYSANINQTQGYLGYTEKYPTQGYSSSHKRWTGEVIYQNTAHQQLQDTNYNPSRILYNSKNQTFSTLV